jgi:CBS domain-containing protein
LNRRLADRRGAAHRFDPRRRWRAHARCASASLAWAAISPDAGTCKLLAGQSSHCPCLRAALAARRRARHGHVSPGASARFRNFAKRKETAMQKVSDIMTRDVRYIAPREKLQRAAQMMSDLDVGALPVCDGKRLVGMVTDRDIIVRGTAAGRGPDDACVADVMSEHVRWCFEDQPIDEVMQQMADSQVRRIPVVSHGQERELVGIVALGDLASRERAGGDEQRAGHVLKEVSTSSRSKLS